MRITSDQDMPRNGPQVQTHKQFIFEHKQLIFKHKQLMFELKQLIFEHKQLIFEHKVVYCIQCGAKAVSVQNVGNDLRIRWHLHRRNRIAKTLWGFLRKELRSRVRQQALPFHPFSSQEAEQQHFNNSALGKKRTDAQTFVQYRQWRRRK